jgi:Sortase domain
MPGEQGNVGLAAHRDTFFSRLKDIRRQDEIRFTSADGVQHYIVEQTRIVDPTDIEVLDPTSSATMTLVTCYPFEYIGSAPQRFVVRAVRRDAGTSGTVAAAAAPNPATIQVRESETIAKPIGRAKARAAAPRAIKTSVKSPHNGRNSNAFARFFKAAARGLGFAPRESREAAQNESPDPRPPGR